MLLCVDVWNVILSAVEGNVILSAVEGWEEMLDALDAVSPLIDDVRPGLRRHEHGEHVIFYRQERGGILISRILHRRMLPDIHAIDDDEQP